MGNCKDLCVIINVTGSVCVHVMGLFVSALALKEICYPHGFLIINLSQANWARIKALVKQSLAYEGNFGREVIGRKD